MQSKTSFFNRTLFRKNLSRYWPLWGLTSFVGALFPLGMWMNLIWGGNIWDNVLEAKLMYLEVLAHAVPIISLLYAVLCAAAVWSYLYTPRSVGLLHTLPIRRSGLFVTNYLSGMAMMLIPYGVTGILTVLITSCYGGFTAAGIGITILGVLAESLLFFSLATLTAFLTGNIFALPLCYFLGNFLAPALDALISLFSQGFLFGVSRGYTGTVEFLSPVMYLMNRVQVHTEYITVNNGVYDMSVLQSAEIENFWLVGVYAAVGIACTALAWLTYRFRRSESAGDVVAVSRLKPVFCFGIAALTALGGGMLLYVLFWGGYQSTQYFDLLPLIFAMLVAGVIGYYGATMLLAKSLRVFRGSVPGLCVVALGVIALCAGMKLDVFHIAHRMPSPSEISQVVLSAVGNTYTLRPGEDDALIQEILEMHQTILDDEDYAKESREQYLATDSNIYAYAYVDLKYTLTGGRTIERSYALGLTRERLGQAGTFDYALDRLINGETMKAKRLHAGDARYMVDSGNLWVERQNNSYNFNSREAEAIFEAVQLDAREGTWGDYDWFAKDDSGNYAMNLSLTFRTSADDEQNDYDYIDITLRPGMTHTIQALLDTGCVTAEDFVTNARMYPESYNTRNWTADADAIYPETAEIAAAVS